MAKVCTAAAAKYLRASDEREMFTNKVEAQAMGMAWPWQRRTRGLLAQEPGNPGTGGVRVTPATSTGCKSRYRSWSWRFPDSPSMLAFQRAPLCSIIFDICVWRREGFPLLQLHSQSHGGKKGKVSGIQNNVF